MKKNEAKSKQEVPAKTRYHLWFHRKVFEPTDNHRGLEIRVLVEALFNPGQVVITAAAEALLDELKLDKLVYLERHLKGDWGELDPQDRKMNDEALASGDDRMLSSYSLPNKEKLWIITEWDRSVTTLLLPDDY